MLSEQFAFLLYIVNQSVTLIKLVPVILYIQLFSCSFLFCFFAKQNPIHSFSYDFELGDPYSQPG